MADAPPHRIAYRDATVGDARLLFAVFTERISVWIKVISPD